MKLYFRVLNVCLSGTVKGVEFNIVYYAKEIKI